MRRYNHNAAPVRGSYPVINNIYSLSAVLGNQRPYREKYFTMWAVASRKRFVPIQRETSFLQKEGKVWWKGKIFLIYFLMTDESNVIWYKTVEIAWLYTPSGVHRQFCALKYAAWVCPSYFLTAVGWLWFLLYYHFSLLSLFVSVTCI